MRLINIVICLLLFYGCGNKNGSIPKIAERQSTVVNVISPDIMNDISLSSETAIILIVDESCSTCIAHFLDELCFLKETDSGSFEKATVLIPAGNKSTINYYLKEQSSFPPEKFSFIEIPDEYDDFLLDYNGYFYVVENGIISEMWVPKYAYDL